MVQSIDLTGMDPQARRFLAMVTVGAQPEAGADIEARRRSFEQLMRFSRKPEEPVGIEDGVIACRGRAIPFRVYTPPASATPSPGLVYFHGGGLVAGGLESHDNLCRRLAVGASCRLIAVDYRLAPEHPFPAAIVDALAAVRHVSRHPGRFGLAPERIAVGGDSGGATLATIVAGLLRRRRTIVAQLLLCPVLELSETTPSRRAFGSGFLLDAATMVQDLVHYAPRREHADPRISPLREPDLIGMPPALIHTAAFDPLLDEGAAYADRLRHAGVAVRYTCHEALVHHFYGLDAIIPSARASLSRIAADLEEALR